jgi:organic radical activating enzyme
VRFDATPDDLSEGNMTIQRPAGKTMDNLAPDDRVKTCKFIEMGTAFGLDGVRCCCLGTFQSPLIVTAEEIRSKAVSYDLVVGRRKDLFAAINGLADGPTGSCTTCVHLKEAMYRDVSFNYLGGESLPAGFNIQHYTACNQYCTYCCFAQADSLIKPQYNILDYLELFRKEGKLRGNNWIDFSGGEPAMLENFDEILNYLLGHNMGTVVVYSNASIFSQAIYDALKKNRIILTTSLDTGMASTYRKLRGANVFPKVIGNLIRYRNSGTRRLWLKYVITDLNRTEDDLWGFVLAMLALKPDRLLICPDFPYGDRQIPEETVKFAARLWYVLEKLTGITPGDYTIGYGDPKWLQYRDDLRNAIQEVCGQKPLGTERNVQALALPPVSRAVTNRVSRMKQRFWDSRLRNRLLPTGSARAKSAMLAWRRTFGRFLVD